jgi:hypothetical protein
MNSWPDKPASSTIGPNAVNDLVDSDRELALLRELIHAASSGPGVEPLAAAAARMITAATASGVCFVYVLEDSDRSLTLAGATPPLDSQVGRIRPPMGSGTTPLSLWIAALTCLSSSQLDGGAASFVAAGVRGQPPRTSR